MTSSTNVFHTDIGRQHLTIDPAFVEYRGKRIRTADVKGVCWGPLRKYLLGVIPATRFYTIWLTSAEAWLPMRIECAGAFERSDVIRARFNAVVGEIWTVVGHRLMVEMAHRLMAGETVAFGVASPVRVTRDGIVFVRALGQWPLVAWAELVKQVENGHLVLSSRDRKARATLSLRMTDNVVIFERLLDVVLAHGNGTRLMDGSLSFGVSPPVGEGLVG